MFRLLWTLSVRTRDYLHRYMPSNRSLPSAPVADSSGEHPRCWSHCHTS